ncbi:hypothetical protein BCR43DRAFT_477134 [Syncephalastrum racemosum]|uniref:Uncharacterized protein n=1 Tax=Syncephalastrum racemosum TaxID=13706 RepID=A0A1X2H5U2_SYNRA|nr:hypothetical protein BCR43DRAFT_477134 [Syncephalastrum racemosum]
MTKNCCFCINLRTATLFLAVLGTVTHLYSAVVLTALADEFEDADFGTVFGLTMYSYSSGFICLAGAMGVIKHNAKYLSYFSAFYWADLALHTVFSVASTFLLFSMHTGVCKEIIRQAEEDLDLETCEAAYIGSAWVVTAAMAINMLLKLHFAFAIRAYMLQVRREEEQEPDTLVVPVYEAQQPPAYEDKKQDVVYVAGREFVPDEKCNFK